MKFYRIFYKLILFSILFIGIIIFPRNSSAQFFNSSNTEAVFSSVVSIQQLEVSVSTERVVRLKGRLSLGSGFIGTKDGKILTAAHVVGKVGTIYFVVLHDGTKKTAKVIYRNNRADIALLDMSGNSENFVTLGSSGETRVGEKVTFIGNTDIKNSTSTFTGLVTGFDKKVLGKNGNISKKLDNLVEVDTKIIQGLSGGPVINEYGNVIGMTVAVDEQNGKSYYIPIDSIKDKLNKIKLSKKDF